MYLSTTRPLSLHSSINFTSSFRMVSMQSISCLSSLLCYILILYVKPSAGKTASSSNRGNDAYISLSKIVRKRLLEVNDGQSLETKSIVSAIKDIQKSQSTLKKLDGAAYEAYQRTHSYNREISSKEELKSVAGRATRYARRLGCAADALFTCEMCELLELSEEEKADSLEIQRQKYGREVVWGGSIVLDEEKNKICPPLNVLCLWEKDYIGEAGVKHGGIQSLKSSSPSVSDDDSYRRGRLLVIIGDSIVNDLTQTIAYLDQEPYPLQISVGLVEEEGSVHEGLWRAAGKLLDHIREALLLTSSSSSNEDMIGEEKRSVGNEENESNDGEESDNEISRDKMPAVHFVGRSLGGGVASLAAAILDGSLPYPVESARKKKRRSSISDKKNEDNVEKTKRNTTTVDDLLPISSISGYGRGRTSAFVLGAPPTLSANIRAIFVTALIHGDDIVCRTTKESIDRLSGRAGQAMKRGILTKNIGWMADTVSLTVSNLKSHAKGSEGEEAKLSIAGVKYFVKPRRLGGVCSLHAVGEISGTEAIRASILWQLDDVLLSKSMWGHHELNSYINAINRIQLRSIESEE